MEVRFNTPTAADPDPSINPGPRGRKKWTHYFWEFLMLFLAVFCGFLAENQRERLIERQQEKEFMVSMLSDLKSDSNNLQLMNRVFQKVVLHVDSLIPLLEQDQLMENNAEKIYQQQVNLHLFVKWIYTDRTVNQLKNSGNFRLIRKKNVSDAISEYDGYVRNIVGGMQDIYIIPQWEKLNVLGAEIFKSSVFRQFMKDQGGGSHYQPIRLPDTPYFISAEKINIQKFINLLQQYAVAIEWFNINTIIAMKKAVKLASVIRKEYHLK